MANQPKQRRMNPKTGKNRIPDFKTIEEAAEFWDTHDSTEFEDEWEPVEGELRFIVVKPGPKKSLTLHLPEETLAALKKRAGELGVRPSALARLWIYERLRSERI